MSAIIPNVPPLDIDKVDEQPAAGATVKQGTAAITSSKTTAAKPVTASGQVEVAIGTKSAFLTIDADATAVEITSAVDGNGDALNMSGTVINAAAGSTSNDTVQLKDAFLGSPANNVKVDLSTKLDAGLGGEAGTTIANQAPGGGEDVQVDTYVHTAGGADSIEGTSGADFIRAGSGNDVVNSQDGNDIVRVGSGNDEVSLGSGKDILYVTSDQLDGSENTITDWNNADDEIQVDANIEGDVDVTIDGDTVSIDFTNPDTDVTTTTTFKSTDGQDFDEDDVEFV